MVHKQVISPFLTVYKPQYSSIFSILERVTGILVTLVVFTNIVLMYLSSVFIINYSFYSLMDCFYLSNSFLINGIIFFVILNLVYHILFGCRFIYWDRTGGTLLYGIELDNLYKSSEYLSIGVCTVSVLTFLFLML